MIVEAYPLQSRGIVEVRCRGVEGVGVSVDVGVGETPIATPGRLERLAHGDGSPLLLADRYRADRYRIDALLGRGGMGSVFLGRHLALGRPVAIKVLHSDSWFESGFDRPTSIPGADKLGRDSSAWTWAVARFMREARLAAKVRHRNVIDVHDFGSTPEGIVYIVMEALSGRDLRAIIAGQGRSWTWTRLVMQQICAGVAAIHRAGVVHRDLKASNCFFVEQTRQLKILDFGIATDMPKHRASGAEPRRTVVGTPEYMAPEQIRGAAPDQRSDVYAAGILLFELLTGQTPFRGRSAEQVFDRHLHEPVPPLPPGAGGSPSAEPELPRGLDSILARALAKDPNRRFQSMVELGRALEHAFRAADRVPHRVLDRADHRPHGGPERGCDRGLDGGLDRDRGLGARSSLRRLLGRVSARDLHEDAPTGRASQRPGLAEPLTLHDHVSTPATPLALELP